MKIYDKMSCITLGVGVRCRLRVIADVRLPTGGHLICKRHSSLT